MGRHGHRHAQDEPLPPETESRLGQFTDLVATAIANAEARARAERLAEEQAALRRVATLVAQEAPPGEVFAKVAEEVARMLGDVDVGAVARRGRRDRDRGRRCRGGGTRPASRLGSGCRSTGTSVIAVVLREGRPHRIDDYSAIAGDDRRARP